MSWLLQNDFWHVAHVTKLGQMVLVIIRATRGALVLITASRVGLEARPSAGGYCKGDGGWYSLNWVYIPHGEGQLQTALMQDCGISSANGDTSVLY